MKRSLLLPLISALFVSFPSAASMMKFAFTGQITQVENDASQVWDPVELIGVEVTGYFLMDVELASHGREETSFYWWHNIDYGPGALVSSIDIANQTYFISGENDYNALHSGWNTNEYLEYYSGLDQFSRPVTDSLYLSDNENIETQTPQGDLYFDQRLSISFSDSMNDFLQDFGPGNGSVEPQPDWLQTFIWENDGSDNNGKAGTGVFYYNQTLIPLSGDRDSQFDSSLRFNLSRVVASPAIAVSAPNLIWIFFCAMLILYLRSDHYRETKVP